MDKIVGRKKFVVERNIHGSFYLINTKQNYLNDKCCLYEINEMGDCIWNKINDNTIDDIVNKVISCIVQCNISHDEIKKDVNGFICLLKNEGFVEVHNGGN